MGADISRKIFQRLLLSGVVLLAVVLAGTLGYKLLAGSRVSVLDCLFMTFITITTIGYSDMIQAAALPGGRVFTMVIALSGISVIGFILTNLTVLIVEGELNKSFKRKKMKKQIEKLKDHYIVCGMGRVGRHVVEEMNARALPHILIDIDEGAIEKCLSCVSGDLLHVVGDASDNDVLLSAGIEQAKGLFATTQDDNLNLVVCLSAKQLNSNIRVVSHCSQQSNVEKMRKVGADSVISSERIGGQRMSVEMINPLALSYFDRMLRDRRFNLKAKEIVLPDSLSGKRLKEIKQESFYSFLLLGVKQEEEFIYNPDEDLKMRQGDVLIFMVTSEEIRKLQEIVEKLDS